MRPDDFWAQMQSRGPATVVVGGVPLTVGSRVRLRPRSHGDILDLVLVGRTAVVEQVEQDDEGRLRLAVTVDDDPGRDLGDARMPGHRFFFAAEDVEPLGHGDPDGGSGALTPRILVAGIGNVFLGDDGFGVEVVRRLAQRAFPPGVDVVDFGIRGMDLVYALQHRYHAAVFVDVASRGEAPGTLTVLQPELPDADEDPLVQTHGMDPVSVLRLARQLGPIPDRIRVLCCEPQPAVADSSASPDAGPDAGPGSPDAGSGGPDDDVLMELSAPVRASLDGAVGLAEELVEELATELAAGLVDPAWTTTR